MRAKGLILGVKRNIITVKTDNSKFKKGDLIKIILGKTRTLKQNRLYWQFLKWACQQDELREMGHFDPDALHQNIKYRLLADKVLDEGVLKVIKVGSTTELTVKEFMEFPKVNCIFHEMFFC